MKILTGEIEPRHDQSVRSATGHNPILSANAWPWLERAICSLAFQVTRGSPKSGRQDHNHFLHEAAAFQRAAG
ncbi:MAG: hypothetical protein ACREDV_00675, partial [Methylocella sp.]